ncbi:hypothetical protein [Gabonibacter chumensis]|uniref:hypothetical protein n=1 Tax=Gabonibacter chumensis TaxID=2972474 RepID=UPI002572A4EF|nr:hypothetical protein [Gabonibacter chumensis]MCR9012083.1 hypothetical protein [Gabonibacter chumensis]
MKYILILMVASLSFAACGDDAEDMPERLSDVSNEFVLPTPAKLTNAERDAILLKREVYNEIYGD